MDCERKPPWLRLQSRQVLRSRVQAVYQDSHSRPRQNFHPYKA